MSPRTKRETQESVEARWNRTPKEQQDAYKAVYAAVGVLSEALRVLADTGGSVTLRTGSHIKYDPKATSCEPFYGISVAAWGDR